VPTLGGMAIFSGLLLASLLWVDRSQCPNLQYIMASLLVVFFIGLKDDILIIAPLTKLYGQIFAALIIVVLGNLHFTNLHGFYQITEIPDWLGMGLSIFVILVITNAFNLIDGIDGLSSGLGILISSTFGIWFYLAGFLQQSIISFALSGALLAFFRFNVFSKTKKIFMGDTGSLILGLMISILVIEFNERNIINDHPFPVYSAPSVSFGILIIPLFDMLRVMFIRVMTGKPIFFPDKNHIHHQLLKLGLGHKKAAFIIIFVNLAFIIFVFTFNQISIRRLLLVILLMAMALSYIPPFLLELKKKRNTKDKK